MVRLTVSVYPSPPYGVFFLSYIIIHPAQNPLAERGGTPTPPLKENIR